MATLKQLEEEIEKIKARNKRVETEKAWELSWTRTFMIGLLTYAVVVTFYLFGGISNPLESAVVPSLVFLLSTMFAPVVKKYWLKNIHQG